MPYAFYLALHLIALLGIVSGMSYLFFSDTSKSLGKILYGVSCFAMLVAGFGLLARTQIPVHTGWVGLKMLVWILVASFVPMISKRFPQHKIKGFVSSMCLLTVAVLAVVYKPF